jgi:hypothetical protein
MSVAALADYFTEPSRTLDTILPCEVIRKKTGFREKIALHEIVCFRQTAGNGNKMVPDALSRLFIMLI